MGRLASLETSVTGMAADVADLKTDVRDLKTDVRDLKTDVRDLKTAAWRTTELLADHSEQLTGLRRGLDDLNERVDKQLGRVNERLEQLGGVNERLDRLIAITMQERTASTERLGDIERRLTRLEERVGV